MKRGLTSYRNYQKSDLIKLNKYMIDEIIIKSIREVVREAGQPEELSEKIVAWLQGAAINATELSDINRYSQRCNLCFDTVELLTNPDD